MSIENTEVLEKISYLIDHYFVCRLRRPNIKCDSIYIRSILNERVGEYFKKSTLNEILFSKGFLSQKIDETNYCFNISLYDLKILGNSSFVLNTLSKKENYSLSEYCKLLGIKNLDLYRYSFPYIIKCKFKSAFFEKIISQKGIYGVLAREIGYSEETVRDCIETFNYYGFPDIPEESLKRFSDIFNLETEECYMENIDLINL